MVSEGSFEHLGWWCSVVKYWVWFVFSFWVCIGLVSQWAYVVIRGLPVWSVDFCRCLYEFKLVADIGHLSLANDQLSPGPRAPLYRPFSPFFQQNLTSTTSKMCSTPTSCNSTASHVSLDVDAPTISHLQLADGTLFFCLVEEDQIEKQKAILFCYEAVSGLKLNFFKNELIGT